MDTRLTEAYELIDGGEISVLSLDIFDTLLWRQVPRPEDLFLILGRRLVKEGWLIPAITAESFVHLRQEAEKKARQIKTIPPYTSEVTLPEIYWQLQPIFVQLTLDQMLAGSCTGVYPGDVSQVMEKELIVEKELIHGDQSIVRLMEYARDKKIPVVLVSDTYFEESAIRLLLGDIPYIPELFLSCEYGCGKQTGLFKIVIEKLGIEANRILHIGDNEKSDCVAASEAGIRTLRYAKYDVDFEKVLKQEWGKDVARRGHLLDDKGGDFGLSALRAKIGYQADRSQFYWRYGAQVLGPVLFGYIHWIYERCRMMGESQVFCLMREGKLYGELIARFAPYYPEHTLKATPLWVSRVFVTHASIESASRKELKAVMTMLMEQVTVGTLWEYLGLPPASMGKWSSHKHMMLEDPKLRQELIEDLVGHKQIIVHASAKRERFLKYLSSLTDAGHMTLVDVGWAGTTQMAMHQMLKRSGSSTSLHGLYLGITDTSQGGVLEGIVREGFLFRGGYPHFSHKKGCFVLEQTATGETGLGPLKDIDEIGKIITHPFWIPDKQKEQAERVQQGIFAYFDQAGPYIQGMDPHSEALHNQLRAILIRSMTNATEQEAVKFGPWHHEHAPPRHLTQPIGKNRYYQAFIKDMVPSAAFKVNDLNWLSAYTAKQSKYLTLATQAVWLDTLPARCFLSEDHYALSVFLDTGRDFPRKAHSQIALRSNPNRHFYTMVRLFSSKKPVLRLQMKLAFPESLVRITSLRMIAYDKSHPVPEQLRFFENGMESQEITCSVGERLDPNTFYCDGNLQFEYAFSHSHIYHIRLKLCCEMFKL